MLKFGENFPFRWPGVRVLQAYRFPAAFLIFGALYLAGTVVLAPVGDTLFNLTHAAILGIFCWVTMLLTDRQDSSVRRGRLLTLQLAACAVVVVATGLDGLVFNHVLPKPGGMPIWQPLSSALLVFLTHHLPIELTRLGISNGIRNLVVDDLPIAVVLMLCGIRLRDMGLGAFRRGSLKSALLWLTIPVLGFTVLVVARRLALVFVGLSWISNLLQNGFAEEFLWRGVILGRVRTILRKDWALVVQALMFGLWHFGADLSAFHGNLPEAFAEMIVDQALFGYAMGYLALKTGNIIIGSAFHALNDAMADIHNLANSAFMLF